MAEQTTTDYSKFDPVWYVDTYLSSVDGQKDEKDLLQFNLDKYHDFFTSGKVTGTKLLDIGTGPSIHSVISAIRHVDDVYLTDYAAQNRKVLTDWWTSDTINQRKLTEYILEKEESNQTVEERQKMMKDKVRGILPIDVTMSQPLITGCDVGLFDVIISSLCLEAAAQTLEQYRKNASHVSSLLKVGGHFLLNGVLEQTFYRVSNSKFECVLLKRDDVEKTFMDLGFEMQSFEHLTFESMEPNDYSDFRGYFVMHATKVR